MYIVLDIETVPDTTLWTPPKVEEEPKTDIAPAKKRRTRKPAGDPFPPLYAHRPIAIGALLLDDNLAVAGLGCMGTSTYRDDEALLLHDFSKWMSSLQATVVTFNGRRFDMPVLALRSFRYGVPAGWYTGEHRKRYSEGHHLDLFDALTEAGAIPVIAGFSLDTFCTILGLPGKNGVDGSKVKGMFERKEIAKIESYCIQDCIREAFVLMRYLLMRGRITLEVYRTAARALFQQCIDQQFGGIAFGADVKRLLLEG